MSVKFIDSHREKICEDILRSLPDWFGIESALVDYIAGVRDKPMWVVTHNGDVVGFISVVTHNPHTAEIYVMGIKEDHHRMGLGKRLVDTVIAWLRANRYESLTVKTLGPSRPNEHYDRTRKFYEKIGFLPIEESKTIWGSANPCLVMAIYFF